jgi:hypothetical protein
LSGAGSWPAEHDGGGGIKALRSKAGAVEHVVEELEPHVAYVGCRHRHDDRIQVGPTGGCGVDVGAERSVEPGCRVRIEQDPPQDVARPVGWDDVGRDRARPGQRNERDLLPSDPGHGLRFRREVSRSGRETRSWTDWSSPTGPGSMRGVGARTPSAITRRVRALRPTRRIEASTGGDA